jgi:hypothetical protein
MQAREKVEKSRDTVFCQCFGAPQSGLAKAAGAEPSGQMRDQKLHTEADFEAKMHKNASTSEHFWKLRY